ncbi:MAG TPA: hypothetical protein VK509_16190, partial [Polyangiales bacterium]|nr:hypothetical protein [Polyangiales bacterium]
RADGERLLLPLPVSYPEGAGLRFVVLLADGTPAFAGAGLCSQVSDQGSAVAAAERFETLLDTLQFDERSRPVYEYIVAVRNASYVQGEEAGDAQSVDVSEADAEGESAAEVEPYAEPDEYATVDETHAVITSHAPVASAYDEPSEQVLWSANQAGAFDSDRAAAGPSWTPSAPPPPHDDVRSQPSFIPPAVPTGLLIRPARVAHWQPAPPSRPTPRPVTGMFRYQAGPLPKPARPPRPELDPALRVRPAPRP